MFEKIEFIIEYIGAGNCLTILVFILSVIINFYIYFKNFYRLVYSTGRICKNLKSFKDWSDENTEFVSRVLFLNNGRKTITRNEIIKLLITSSNHIFEIKTFKEVEDLKLTMNKNEVNIDFKQLDSAEFILLEIKHSGSLSIEGRISETGKILHTETKTWIIIHIIFLLFFFANMIYNFYTYLKPEITNLKMLMLNLLILFALAIVLRQIHKLFFIPDSISSKYLDSKDKLNREFMNEL